VTALAAIMMALALAPAGIRELLRLEPRWWFEPWRLWTGHLVHLSFAHAALNAGTFLLFAALFPSLRGFKTMTSAIFFICLGVDLAVLLIDRPAWYTGFSGVVYGLAATGLLLDWARLGSLAPWFALGLGAKLLSDTIFGTPNWTEDLVGGSVLAAAHSYGVAAGLVVGIGLRPSPSA